MNNRSVIKKSENYLNNHQQKYSESVKEMTAQKYDESIHHSRMIRQGQWCSNCDGQRRKNFSGGIMPPSFDFPHGAVNMIESKFEESIDDSDIICQNSIQSDDRCRRRKFPRRISPFQVVANLSSDLNFDYFEP